MFNHIKKYSLDEWKGGRTGLDFSSFANDPYLGNMEIVDSAGGPDKGNDWYQVRYFAKIDTYIKIEGYYTSFGGLEVDTYGVEVFPKVVKETIYDNKC